LIDRFWRQAERYEFSVDFCILFCLMFRLQLATCVTASGVFDEN